LYEEAAIFSFEKVFIFQPAFRAEKSKTSKHLTEFWMIEAEQAFVSQEENLKLQEDLVNAVVSRVAEKRAKDLEVLGRKMIVPEPPFLKMSYDEVRDMAEKKGMGFEWGEDIPTGVERMVSQTFDRPFFITDYPLSARSFYHVTKPDNDKVTKSADLIAPEGYGEIATGGERISDYDKLMERVKKQELPAESFQWYLDLRKYGMPTHAGFGIGVERTARWLCGLKHIRAASLFPRTITRVNP
jgi:asparaginyl-tRNA synthetase